jgi:activator of HSP90 ATPase
VPAEIDPKEGGAFSLFEGQVVGRNVELLPNQRIVQAWRPAHWDAGRLFRRKVRIETTGSPGALSVLDRAGFPEGDFDHLTEGWGITTSRR